MRKILLTTGALLTMFFVSAQNVGIGINPPAEKLHVDEGHIKIGSHVWSGTFYDRFLKFGDGDFVFLGETGEDDRMVLYARNFIFTKSSTGYSGNVGIGTASAPTAKLEVNGDIKITDGTQGTNKVLRSAADGTASWVPSAINSGFKGIKTVLQLVPSSSSSYVVFSGESYDDGSNFSSDEFTAPTDGLYHFDVKLTWSVSGAVSRYNLITVLYIGSTEAIRSQSFVEAGTSGNLTTELSTDLKLTTGQRVSISVNQSSGVAQSIIAANTSFSGHKLY